MKGLKKLVLASAIIAASSSAFAMQAMDDDSMSATTGQDGLTITMGSSLSNVKLTYVDRDGITGDPTYNTQGAIIIDKFGIDALGQTIKIDAGGNGTNGMLQINVGTSAATVVHLEGTNIQVANATGAGVATTTSGAVNIISFDSNAKLTIAASPNLMNIQLGHETQGAMISMNSNLGDVTLTGLSINDANSGGSITLGSLTVQGLNAVNKIDVVAGGLQIVTNGTTIDGLALEGIKLGAVATAVSLGDVYITGAAGGPINLDSTITVTGH